MFQNPPPGTDLVIHPEQNFVPHVLEWQIQLSKLEIALGFDLVGWIKNRREGTVELQVMGDDDEVSEFIHEITKESELAPLIKDFQISEIAPLENCRSFRIAG